MSILVTGDTGFIGVGLTRKLVEKDEDVVLFDIVPRIERVADIKDKVKVIQGDLKVWTEVLNLSYLKPFTQSWFVALRGI